uniref:PIPK domain-containing protein n=1 Tax=Periophthalmus magnuspinnatus TaxID=409849 RepID=A0A3B4BDL8_9GOBI
LPSSNLLTSLAPKRKTKKKHFVQQKVEVFRASDPVLSVLMWGVNHSMTDLCHVPSPVMLLPDDFKANTKIKVTNHFFNKENLPGQFKFKEYCPQVFRNLREHFGIEDQDFQQVKARPVFADLHFSQTHFHRAGGRSEPAHLARVYQEIQGTTEKLFYTSTVLTITFGRSGMGQDLIK